MEAWQSWGITLGLSRFGPLSGWCSLHRACLAEREGGNPSVYGYLVISVERAVSGFWGGRETVIFMGQGIELPHH